MESSPVSHFRRRDIYMRARNNPQGLFRQRLHGPSGPVGPGGTFREIRGKVPIYGANGAGRPPQKFMPPPVNRLISQGGSLEPPRTNV